MELWEQLEFIYPSMGEGRAILAGPLNTVRTMATRDIYETSFDEDVQTESNANQCPECDGRVHDINGETVSAKLLIIRS